MFILALESTTEACSVALYSNGSITESFQIAPRQHTQLLLKMVDELLLCEKVEKEQLNAIAFCRGPGAFTGLRITTGIAQGLAYGLDIPLIPVSSLAALAQGAFRITGKTDFLSCLDARKNEVFWGFYNIEQGYATLSGVESVSSVGKAIETLNDYDDPGCYVVGTALSIFEKINEPKLSFVDSVTDNIHYPHAYDIAYLAANEFEAGNTVTADQAVPVYLRNKVTD